MSEKPAVRKTRIVKKRVPKVKPELETQNNCEEGVCRIVVPEHVPEPEKQPAHVKFISSPESSTTEAADSEVQEALEVLEEALAPKSKRKQKKFTKEEISELYDVLLETIDSRLSEDNLDTSQKKFLKNTKKSVKDLKNGTLKTMKKPRKDKDSSLVKPPSGLTKPVLISDEMVEFTGSHTNQKSRVDITRALCAYIKENNLQNPANKREIVPDARLARLLDYDESVHGPLTYCSIHGLVKKHFPKIN